MIKKNNNLGLEISLGLLIGIIVGSIIAIGLIIIAFVN